MKIVKILCDQLLETRNLTAS